MCLFIPGAGSEARTRSPASHERPSAIRGNPVRPRIENALRALRRRYRVRLLPKKQDIQTGCPVSLWSGQRGSNSLPPPWQGGALPDELCPQEWCPEPESNQRHVDFQSTALPTELSGQIILRTMERGRGIATPRGPTGSYQIPREMATRNGLEPSTSSVTG